MVTPYLFSFVFASLVAAGVPDVGSAQPAAGGAVRHPETSTVEVIVDGHVLPVHVWRGARYIEALKGREYAIRLHNPLDRRVAVALSIDGLNTIDARRTSAAQARKWVLGPNETVTISGWQSSRRHARRFFFTSEEDSYAQALGHTRNLGLISAAFFRERHPMAAPVTATPSANSDATAGPSAEREQRRERSASSPAPTADDRAARPEADEYAATGIGRQTDHPVEQVFLDLESSPAATIELRYEYRAQLVRLGVLRPSDEPLARRERAQGFEPGFCPEPPRRRPH
jgi:hypothetical protein